MSQAPSQQFRRLIPDLFCLFFFPNLASGRTGWVAAVARTPGFLAGFDHNYLRHSYLHRGPKRNRINQVARSSPIRQARLCDLNFET